MPEKTKHYDVIVVGAGPSGLNCAIRLADAGLSTLVIDKATFPREKICGDALSDKVISNIKTLPSPIYENFHKLVEKLPCYGIKFASPNFTELTIPYALAQNPDDAAGYIIPRKSFDHFMMKAAEGMNNLDLITGAKVIHVECNNSECQVSTNENTYSGEVLVGADGAHSITAQKLTGYRYKNHPYFIGLRAYYENVKGFDANNYVEIYFTRKLNPGYFWIFPLPDNQANIGVGLPYRDYRKRAINLKHELEQLTNHEPFFRERFAKSKLISTIRGEIIPMGLQKRQISGNRFILTGDAAGLGDPLTAEGIGNAFISGRLAAETIIKFLSGKNPEEYSLKAYDERIRQYLGKEFKLNKKLHQLTRYEQLFNFLFKRAKDNQSIINLFLKMGNNLDARKMLTKPSLYLRLLLGFKR
ncbi:MAG: NAD(P)/FAD-dependent oxidoreductase [Bacteroidales bacterium]|nr:NAD(P)/FAD-dependent oxidoreductase [Bacteroidales bacterium]